ncbi:MAG: 6-phosphofructokinase [Bacteroidetes bacterium MED-G17]|jgi:6-phosphofructokinase 1|nr:MAG: 6-phosphofructokinase [Bacteroidetes bacterium MED-G17]CAI8267242.1 MAG: ATP-dependent 6-phosphofructokinase 1 [Bacteroidetes bacterium MED-G17]|tara:strand:+ start:31658 stop:32626 length:969 start_codon:yes stop_codon:yes gene_type:complete
MNTIGVYTSGGDAPGMNACIRAVVRSASYYNIEVKGIKEGYQGMIENKIVNMDSSSVANIIQRGGTILKTARSEEFKTQNGRKKAFDNLLHHKIDGLICIGGNGSYTGAKIFSTEYQMPVIGVPGTIDNDLFGTDYTIGYDTATNTALDAIDKIRDTADSHNRVFLVEVMGRDAGYIALNVGIAGGAEGILIPEDAQDFDKLTKYFKKEKRKKSFSIIVIAEGDEEGGAIKLGEKLKATFPYLSIKTTVLGHVQRGGSPTVKDRILASRLGANAVKNLVEGESQKAVGIINDKLSICSLDEAISKHKDFPKELINLAEVLGS